tara:strand:- start:1070 stop:1408 length:339 start_codon:yes stop_codon:yes gene_type:complete
MEDPKVTQQHIIDDINNNTESWFGKEKEDLEKRISTLEERLEELEWKHKCVSTSHYAWVDNIVASLTKIEKNVDDIIGRNGLLKTLNQKIDKMVKAVFPMQIGQERDEYWYK